MDVSKFTNALNQHEQSLAEFLRLVDDVLTQEKAEIEKLKQLLADNSDAQPLLDAWQVRIEALTQAINISRGKL